MCGPWTWPFSGAKVCTGEQTHSEAPSHTGQHRESTPAEGVQEVGEWAGLQWSGDFLEEVGFELPLEGVCSLNWWRKGMLPIRGVLVNRM